MKNKFYEDKDSVEHKCCWNTAICIKVEKGKGRCYSDEKLVLECNNKDVEFILNALNHETSA